jgi:integrase
MDYKNNDQKCKNRFRIRQFIASDGRRFALLFDSEESAWPALAPTAFCLHQLSNKGAATERQYLQSIKKTLEWAADQNVDLEALLQSAKFPVPLIDSLAQALNKKQKLGKDDEEGATVTPKSFNSAMEQTHEYFTWLFIQIRSNPNSTASEKFLERLTKAFKSRKRKTGSDAAYAQCLLNKKLSEPTRLALTERFEKPFGSHMTEFQKGVLFRDALMLEIFYELGIRLGELLSLKLAHFIQATGGDHAYLDIVRNQDDKYDRRVSQPVVKTNGRKLAISPELERKILTYLGDWRAIIPGAGFDDNSFLFIAHKAGPSQGQALQISAIRSFFTTLRRKDKRLSELHPHLVRHDWNYRFSKECQSRGISEKREMEERCFLMGWRDNSDMAKHYNRRHIAEQAYEVSLSMAKKINRPKS